jgi:hypothetical protein
MASITKLELQQALAARNAELEAARLRIAELEGDVAALKSKCHGLEVVLGGTYEANAELTAENQTKTVQRVKAVYVRPERQPTPEQLAYQAALAQAKDFAMRTGRSVKVERP